MSGGSYDYLCRFMDTKSPFEVLHILERMRDDLSALGYADDAAQETDELICLIRQFRTVLYTRVDRFQGVWHDMEWWRSCDYGEDQFKEGLEKYRRGLRGEK